MKNLARILTFISMLVLASCVGTVQEKTKKLTDTTIVPPVKIVFGGITKGKGVAHNKVQLNFMPASGGSGKFSYLVYMNGNLSVPVASVSADEIVVDKNGEYSLVVSEGLSLGTSYTFLVKAFDLNNNTQDSNNVQVVVATLNYLTPLFAGVQTVENFPGKEGETTLLIKWNKAEPATKPSGLFSTNDDTISGYNIYIGTSEETIAFYASLNDPTAVQLKVSNLEAGKIYFIRVRAKNSKTIPIEDENLKFLTKKTLSQLPISFAGVKTLSIPNTVAGYTTIKLTWTEGTGNYDRYRIYARKDIVSSFNSSSTDHLITTITDLGVTSTNITVSEANVHWYVAVVACSDAACTSSQGQNVVKYIRTTPSVASFNGIKTISQPSGVEGLTAVDLQWDLPDASSGVYDEIRFFKSDAAGNFDQLLDRVDNVTYSLAFPLTPGVSLRGTTLIRINGLETGKQACFVAQAYATTPIDVSSPNGRTNLAKVTKCFTPQYNAPGFAGVKLTCTNKTAKSFKITWDKPVPLGTFDEYEIYLKEGGTGFNTADAVSLSAGYTKKLVLSDQTSLTLTGLLMNTTYQILAKTHFVNPTTNLHYRDNNSIIATCNTSAPTIEQNSWVDIFAVGPKFNGLTGTAIPETLMSATGATTIGKTEWKHQYPIESSGAGVGVTESDSGIIRLSWEDMTLSDSLGTLRDYNATTNTGYKIYRLPHSLLYGASGPSLSDNWGTPINTDYVQGSSIDTSVYTRLSTSPQNKPIVHFVDYTLTHPYKTDIARANEATVYWYKVEPWYNGKKIVFSSIASDAVVKVVLPPKNMAFMHRWMVNKQRCEEMGLTPSRSHNYRCPYTGTGAVLDDDDSQYYADAVSDLLVDRFEMGCNFSRGTSAYSCTNTGAMVGFEGTVDDTTTGRKAKDCIGFSNLSPQGLITAKQGAVFYNRYTHQCYVNTTACGTPGCSGTTWNTLIEIDGNTKFGFDYFPDGSVAGLKVVTNGITKIPPQYSPVESSIVPITKNVSKYSAYSQGLGYGARIYSNDSKLPVLQNDVDPVSLFYVCQSNHITINNKNHLKRTSRRIEAVAYGGESPFLSQESREKLERGDAQLTADTATSVPGINYVTLPLNQHNDRDCNAHGSNQRYYTKYVYDVANAVFSGVTEFVKTYVIRPKVKVRTPLAVYDYAAEGYTKDGLYIMPGRVLNFFDPRYSTGGVDSKDVYEQVTPVITTGSSGFVSTEACVSRYGVQDYTGNASEYNSDLFYCDASWGCSPSFKDLAQTVPFVPPIDPDNRNNYKSPNGKSYFTIDTNSPASAANSFGTKLLQRFSSPGLHEARLTAKASTICRDVWGDADGIDDIAGSFVACQTGDSDPTPSAKYFNTLLGLPVDCDGGFCTYDNQPDDNHRVTARIFPASSATAITNFPVDSISMTSVKERGANHATYDVQYGSKPVIKGMETGGNSSYEKGNGRFKLDFANKYNWRRATGRCVVELKPTDY